MLGFDALGRLALGELPRQPIGPAYAVLAAAAVASFVSPVNARASTAAAMSGAGAFSTSMVGQVSAVLAVSGSGVLTLVGLSQPNSVFASSGFGSVSFPFVANAYVAVAVSGVGAVTLQGISIANSAMTSSGSAIFTPTMRAEVSAIAVYSGTSIFGAADEPSSVVSFSGTSNFAAVSYAFYLDAERACAHQENTTAVVVFEDRIFRTPYEDRGTLEPDAVVPLEDRIAIVPAEYRIYHVAADRPGAGSQPRKRVC